MIVHKCITDQFAYILTVLRFQVTIEYIGSLRRVFFHIAHVVNVDRDESDLATVADTIAELIGALVAQVERNVFHNRNGHAIYRCVILSKLENILAFTWASAAQSA